VTVFAISPYQLILMEHALGFRSKNPYYRNRFCATANSPDDREWEELVEKGIAVKKPQPDGIPNPYNSYAVSELGLAVFRNGGKTRLPLVLLEDDQPL
jgi:hypothetical protein